jgi:citrate lyase subunit beta/citryl-CoA lyase
MSSHFDRVGWLLSPAGDERMVRGGTDTHADVLVPDLEDATSYPDRAKQDVEKERAREILVDVLEDAPTYIQEFIPRINTLDSDYWEADVDTLVPARPDGFLVPKVRSTGRIRRLSERITALESEHGLDHGSIDVALMIETPYSVRNLHKLASADDRVDALVFGPGDYSLNLGVLREDEKRFETLHSTFDSVRMKISNVANELGIYGVDGPASLYSLLTDAGYTPEGYEYEHSNRSARMGFDGKIVLHPSQLRPVREGFAPPESEVEKARQLVEFREEAHGTGERTVRMLDDGEIILPAFIAQAEQTLARYETLDSREQIANGDE